MSDWKEKFISDTISNFGFMPAPWVYQTDCHPYSIGWRMGGGESYMMCIFDWLKSKNWSVEEKANFFKEQEVPPAWLLWVYEVLYSVDENEYEKDEVERINAYREKLEKLGFKNIDSFESDFNDEKWQ